MTTTLPPSPLDSAFVFRPDLRFLPRPGKSPCCLVEDPENSAFYRIGLAEYALLAQMKQGSTARESLKLLREQLPDFELSDLAAERFCVWMKSVGLVRNNASSLQDPASSHSFSARFARWNPLCVRIPLARPDNWLARVSPLFFPLMGKLGALLWASVILIALVVLIANSERFAAEAGRYWLPTAWLWLAPIWLALKIVHELAHGVACKRSGGKVAEAGLLFILFAPIAYIDVTSAWSLRSRYQRIAISAAGMAAELFIAGLAAIAWSLVEHPLASALLQNIVIAASAQTLLVNANPFMRFDGYYILSDLLGVPNLYSRSLTAVRSQVGNIFLGGGSQTDTSRPNLLLLGYGLGALLWRCLVVIGLLIAAALMFHGLGLLLAVFAALAWIGLPLYRSLCGWLSDSRMTLAAGLRAGGLAAALAITTFTFLLATPSPWRPRAEGVIALKEEQQLRAKSAGFLQELWVADGDVVSAGDPLLRLENRRLEQELADLKLELQQLQVAAQIHSSRGEQAQFQAQQEAIASCRERLEEKQTQWNELTLRAPCGGTVLAESLDQQTGRWIEKGEILLTIADPEKREVRFSVDQAEIDAFSTRNGPLRLKRARQELGEVEIVSLNPRASRAPPHEALCTTAGGPLVVEKDPENENDWRFPSPRFCGTASIPDAIAPPLFAGQLVTLYASDQQRSLAGEIGNYFQKKAEELLVRWEKR